MKLGVLISSTLQQLIISLLIKMRGGEVEREGRRKTDWEGKKWRGREGGEGERWRGRGGGGGGRGRGGEGGRKGGGKRGGKGGGEIAHHSDLVFVKYWRH